MAEEIAMLEYALPEGYMNSARHVREELLSQRMGTPLTEEVKLARRLAELKAGMVVAKYDPAF